MSERPNILIYCTDQQRADLLGCMGHPLIRTPCLDAFAARGVLLRNLFVQSPVCMSSRASILTGRYPSAHGVVDNGFELPATERTLADLLGAHGYFTACVGRTHLSCSLPHPILPDRHYHGFQECHHSQCYWPGLDPHSAYLKWLKQNFPDRYEEAAMPNPVDREDAFCTSWTTLDDDKTMTAWVTLRSLEVLRRHRDRNDRRPFLLWAGTWDPHARFVVPPPWDRMYPPQDIPLPVRSEEELSLLPPHFQKLARRSWPHPRYTLDEVIRNTLSIYWGMISHVDDQFGRLLRGLEELGLADNTIMVFLSDHGEMAGDHWLWYKGPYFFDCTLRVPGIVVAPGRLPAGRVTDALVETVDVVPTLLELAGVPIPPEIQGRSCRALIEGRTDTHRPEVFTEYQDFEISGERLYSIRTDRYRLTVYQGKPYGELFDLQADPNALKNRWNDPAYATTKSALQLRLLERLLFHLARPDTRLAKW